MSTNGNGWKPRKSIVLPCPSGQQVTVMRPGPEFILRNGKIARTFSKSLSAHKPAGGQSMENYGEEIIAKMSDEEIATLMLFAKGLVCAMLVSPKLVLAPRPDADEIGPEDVPPVDFWFLFNYGMENFMDLKVPIADTEVEVSDLETFRSESGIQGDSMDSAHLPVTESERAVTDQGLVGSAGA